MKCSRLKCPNSGHPSKRGMCNKHYIAELTSNGRAMGYADVEPVIAHLQILQDSGLSLRCISKNSGVSVFGVSLILTGQRKRVWAETAKKILSVAPDILHQADDGAYISPLGTIRRLRALYAIGYSAARLEQESGLAADRILDLLNGVPSVVRAKTARRVDEMFRRLQLKPLPPSRSASRARNKATRLGWAKPLEWDEDEIDNPSARPHKPNPKTADWFPAYRKLKAGGLTNTEIARQMGITADSLRGRLRRIRAA